MFFEPYPMGLGGNFLTQRLILERIDRERFCPIVVAPIEGVALEHFRKMDIECVVLPPPGRLAQYGHAIVRSGVLGRLRVAIDLVRYNLEMARFLRERKINVIYANCVRAQMSVGLASWLAGVPSLLYIKGELVNPVIDRLCFMLAARICFQCPQNRDDKYPGFVRWYRRKIDILRPGLDPAAIRAVEMRYATSTGREIGIDGSRVNTIVLGQLYPLKGQKLAIEALADLIPAFPNVRLYIVGDHVIDEYRPYEAELHAQIERLGLGKHVHFTGWRTDALEILGHMDILIHPSYSEGFPGAVLEAMALGKPVVATRVGGLREIIKDGHNGFLVDPGDERAIARRWRELVASRELRERLGSQAKRAIFADYLVDDKVARFAEICVEMAGARRRPWICRA